MAIYNLIKSITYMILGILMTSSIIINKVRDFYGLVISIVVFDFLCGIIYIIQFIGKINIY